MKVMIMMVMILALFTPFTFAIAKAREKDKSTTRRPVNVTSTGSNTKFRPASIPSPVKEEDMIKVAGQFVELKDGDFPSCFSRWESDIDNVAFELVAGHFLIDTPYKVTDDLPPGDCIQECRKDPDCRSLNIDYKRGTCEYLSVRLRRGSYPNQSSPRIQLRPSVAQNYFEKICLPFKSSKKLCPERDWAFERVRESSLVGYDKVNNATAFVVPSVETREFCQFLCLNHTAFVCRSVEFNYDTKECTLSGYNRFSSSNPNVSLEKKSNIDYFESNCAAEVKGFCNTKGVKDHRQVLTEKLLITPTLEECQMECLSGGVVNVGFVCRSFTYEPSSRTCSLSHHSTKSSHLVKSTSHVYFEVSSCFEVKVDCEPDVMQVHIKSNLLFGGKVYARDRPKSCFVDVGHSMDFTLPIRLYGDDCATSREAEGEFTNVVVIQGNDQVVTAFDKAVGVRCSFDVGPNKTLKGETSLSINEINFLPEKKFKSTASLPAISLHITDREGRERDSFPLGELIKVQVRMSDETVYGIFVRNIVAKGSGGVGSNRGGRSDSTKGSHRDTTSSESSAAAITLIDQTGCPGEGRMMREVRTLDESSKSLESVFEAFSFTGSNQLVLEAEVETCLDRCRPVHCQVLSGRSDDSYQNITSYGRRRRRRDAIIPHQLPGEISQGDVLRIETIARKIIITSPVYGGGLNPESLETNKSPKNSATFSIVMFFSSLIPLACITAAI